MTVTVVRKTDGKCVTRSNVKEILNSAYGVIQLMFKSGKGLELKTDTYYVMHGCI